MFGTRSATLVVSAAGFGAGAGAALGVAVLGLDAAAFGGLGVDGLTFGIYYIVR